MKKGFTLVEVMAVLIILSIISLVTVPLISGFMTGSSEDTDRISLESLVKVVKNDYQGNVRYGLVTYTLDSNTLICTSGCTEGKITIKYNGDLGGASGTISMNDQKINMNIDTGKYIATYKQAKCTSKDFRKNKEKCTTVNSSEEVAKCGSDGDLCTFVEKVVLTKK